MSQQGAPWSPLSDALLVCFDAQHLPPPSQCSPLSFLRTAGPPERANLHTKVGERTRMHERALAGS